MSLGLSDITTASLTDTSSGGNTFTINGWTGGGNAQRHERDTGGECVWSSLTLSQHVADGNGRPGADFERIQDGGADGSYGWSYLQHRRLDRRRDARRDGRNGRRTACRPM